MPEPDYIQFRWDCQKEFLASCGFSDKMSTAIIAVQQDPMFAETIHNLYHAPFETIDRQIEQARAAIVNEFPNLEPVSYGEKEDPTHATLPE